MQEFDYGNARLRAMKSRLLSQDDLETLAGLGSLMGLIAALTQTAYRKSVEAALLRFTGMNCIAYALDNDLVNTLGKLHNFYRDEAYEMVMIILRRYDLHNLKTILRGLAQHITPAEILSAILPVGELRREFLAELVRASDPRAAIDLLASINSNFARPLLDLRERQPGADIPQMELALEQWSFSQARSRLADRAYKSRSLSSALDLEVDITNLLTVLRFAQVPGEHNLLREWLGEDNLNPLLIGPGSLPFTLLVQAGTKETLDVAIATFDGTVYGEILRTGFDAYLNSYRLSDLERQLRIYRLHWMSEQIINDPLGVGVVLGYSALKVNEIGNLRWIASGINLGLDARSIRARLEYVA